MLEEETSEKPIEPIDGNGIDDTLRLPQTTTRDLEVPVFSGRETWGAYSRLIFTTFVGRKKGADRFSG